MTPAGRVKDLDSRSLEILEAVVRLHSETGRPVSSGLVVRYLARSPSPATVRAVMKHLEDQGLLEQPHTSAGRLPTDRGHRIFVDRLRSVWSLRRHEVPPGMLQLVGDVSSLPVGADRIKDLARLLSLLTRNISIIVGPSRESVAALRLEFFPRTLRRVLMVLTLEGGQVLTRHLDLPEDFPAPVVDEAARVLDRRVRGLTVGDIRRGALSGVDLVRTPVSRCAEALAAAGRPLVEDLEEGEVELEGVPLVLEEPEFQEAEPLKALLRFIGSPREVREALNRLHRRSQDPFGVWIGRENPIGSLRRFTVLTAGFELDGRPGLQAVLGPRRLPYQRAFHGMEILRSFSGGHPQVPPQLTGPAGPAPDGRAGPAGAAPDTGEHQEGTR